MLGRFRSWFATSFCHGLQDAVDKLSSMGISLPAVRLRAVGSLTQPFTLAQARRADRRMQRAVGELLRAQQRRFPEVRMRQKLERWDLPLFPRLRAERAVDVSRRLAALTPPRVAAAVLRTYWSGWCTARRFGGRARGLFCGDSDGDSVEHASICKVLAGFGRDHMRLPGPPDPGDRRLAFLLLLPRSQLGDVQLTLGALRLAAAYRVHCLFRRRPERLRTAEAIRGALGQAVKELVQGHRIATQALDQRWHR